MRWLDPRVLETTAVLTAEPAVPPYDNDSEERHGRPRRVWTIDFLARMELANGILYESTK